MPRRVSAELRRLLRIPGRPVEQDVEDEIAFHVESRIAALQSHGYSAQEAQRLALAEFGDITASRRELVAVDRRRRQRQQRGELWTGAAQDLRYAARSLRRSPGFTLSSFATLSVGLGACTAAFTVVNNVLLRPLPFPNADRLVAVWHDMAPINLFHTGQSVTTYFTYRTQAHTIDGIGIYKESAANVAVTKGTTDPARLDVGIASASLFQTLGASAALGRVFSEDEDRVSAPPVALISDGVWRAQFGADPHVVGRRVEVNGISREIVGVMPRSFRFPSPHTALWIPLNADPLNPPKDAFTYSGVARLKRGVALTDALRDFAGVLPRVSELYPKFVPGITTHEIMEQTKPRPGLAPLKEDMTGGVARALSMLAIAGALVLLVACVNVGNLVLVRFDARRRELAIRRALGAGTGRIARYCFAEVLLIALSAMLAALFIAYWLIGILVAQGGDTPRLAEVAVGAHSALFAVVAAIGTAAICSVIPMLRLRRGTAALRPGARGATTAREEHRIRRILIGAQMAFALVVLAGSGLLFRSFERLQSVRLGFDPDRVATYWVSLPPRRYPSDSAIIGFYSDLIDRTRSLPGVATTGVSSRLPLIARGKNDNPLYPEDAAVADTKLPPLQLFTTIGGEYFRTLGIPLLAGKQFDPMTIQREGDAIVSSRTAEMFWHDATGRSVVGKRFRVLPTSRLYTVVGVVADVHDTTLVTRPAPTVYFPETSYSDPAQRQIARTMALTIRTGADPSSITADVQRIVRELDPTLPIFDIQPMTRAVAASTTRLRFTMLMLGGAAAVTLLLGAVGLYGMMAYIVSLRRRELGIRIALGASPASIAITTSREAMTVATLGVAVGIVLFGIAARFIRTLLFGIAPWDPTTLAATTAVLLAMALLASWLPARRAAMVDPAEALRAD